MTTTNTVAVPVTTTPVSPKAWGALAFTLAASIVAALCATVVANPAILDGLPTWAVGLIIGILPTVGSFFGAYKLRDTLRDAGAEHLALTQALDSEAPHEATLAGFDAIVDEPDDAPPVPQLTPGLEAALTRYAGTERGLPDYLERELSEAGYAVTTAS